MYQFFSKNKFITKENSILFKMKFFFCILLLGSLFLIHDYEHYCFVLAFLFLHVFDILKFIFLNSFKILLYFCFTSLFVSLGFLFYVIYGNVASTETKMLYAVMPLIVSIFQLGYLLVIKNPQKDSLIS